MANRGRSKKPGLMSRKVLLGTTVGASLFFMIVGVIFWGGFNTFMEYTNTYEFCTSCHEMNVVQQEYEQSIHAHNRSGVPAVCSDCHVPKPWGAKVLRKIKATNELYHKLVGTIDTPEKFEQERLTLAKHVWRSMEKTDSRECRNCHSKETMLTEVQSPEAQKEHKRLMKGEATCIHCHKGIAHKIPDMEELYAQRERDYLSEARSAELDDEAVVILNLVEMTASPGGQEVEMTANPEGQEVGMAATSEDQNVEMAANPEDQEVEMAASPDSPEPLATLYGGTPVKILKQEGDWFQVAVEGWDREEGSQIFIDFNRTVPLAKMSFDGMDQVEKLGSKLEPEYELTWNNIKLTGWVPRSALGPSEKQFWNYVTGLYELDCNWCHQTYPRDQWIMFDWRNNLKEMRRYTNLNMDQLQLVSNWVLRGAREDSDAD